MSRTTHGKRALLDRSNTIGGRRSRASLTGKRKSHNRLRDVLDVWCAEQGFDTLTAVTSEYASVSEANFHTAGQTRSDAHAG